MAITPLPNPPSRSDPANFPERADAFMAALPTFAQEANLLQAQVNEAAEAADNNATAAAGSAQDAATSRNQATQKAADAGQFAEAAASAKAASDSAASLAAQWASKTGAPVAGGEFSAKHYAQLAAQGMGLPVFALGNIPTADVGPIFVPTQGPMEWRNGRYVVQRADHGQCRFNYVSTGECRLVPYNGDGLVINGRQYRIPAAGIVATNSGLAANTWYYAYAKDNGAGAISIEFMLAVTNPHSKHTDGVEIRTGDPTRTLVGQVLTNASAWFVSGANYRWVLSWFNRIFDSFAETPINSTTAATSYVKLTNGFYVLMWAGTSSSLALTGIVRAEATGGVGAYLILTADGGGFAGGHGYTLRATGDQMSTAVVAPYIAVTDKAVNFAPYGNTNLGSIPVTFRNDFNCQTLI